MVKMVKIKKSILVILVAGIGDLILASKSIRAIRNGYPDADIHLLTSSEAVPIAQNYKYVDYVWAFPIREMRKSKRHLFDVWKLLLKLRRTGFSMVVNLFEISSLHGAINMSSLFLLLNARVRVGHNNKGFGLALTDKVPSGAFRKRHRVDAMMDVALLSGGIPDNGGINVFWNTRCEEKWGYLFEWTSPSIKKVVVGINPGGDWKSKRWSPDNFATIADKIIDEFGAKMIILGGPGEENIGSEIQQRMRNNAVNLSGKLNLNELVYIISRLDVLITNDSGPMHIGAATGTPLVAIFGPGDPTLVRPYTSKKLYSNDKCTQHVCLDIVTPEEVYEKCIELLLDTKW
jgi:lipopolysaccharide heptosyltransferase II